MDHPIDSIFHTRPQLLDALKSGILLQGVQEGSSLVDAVWCTVTTTVTTNKHRESDCAFRKVTLMICRARTLALIDISAYYVLEHAFSSLVVGVATTTTHSDTLGGVCTWMGDHLGM